MTTAERSCEQSGFERSPQASHELAERPVDSNPFSTRFVRPGALEYLFSEGDSATRLVERLMAGGGRGQIIGPHGSGKTTLVHTLLDALAAAQVSSQLITVREPAAARRELDRALKLEDRTLLIVDGYDRLDWWTRRRLPFRCRLADLGLLAVAHRSIGLPLLVRTQVTQKLVERVVERLVRSTSVVISNADIERARKASRDNLRETLFALYDLVEHRRPQRC